jgi:hypothetical protein
MIEGFVMGARFSQFSSGAMLASACLTMAVACAEDRPTDLQTRSPKPKSVRETFDQLRKWHEAGAYSAMRPYIAESGREGLIELLVAVDQLVAANAGFLSAARQTCPDLDLRRYDLSFTQDALDLFSRRVDWVGVKESGDTATVTAEVSERLPLVEMSFKRQGDHWAYVPGTEHLAVIEVIRQMSRSLKQIEQVVSTHKTSDRQLEDEYRVRMLPKIRKISAEQ